MMCTYVFVIYHSELYLLHFVSGELNEYVMLCYFTSLGWRAAVWTVDDVARLAEI